MNKWRVAIVSSLMLGLIVSIGAFAHGFGVVNYDDVEIKNYFPGAVTTDQYIANGDFLFWGPQPNGIWGPNNWVMEIPSVTNGWEVHFAEVDVSPNGDDTGINNAAGMFFRTGPKGSQYANMYQQTTVPAPGLYWMQIHITAWENNVEIPYNSVAWYGFSSSNDVNSVTEWRELFPDTRVCPNEEERCNYLARKETVALNGGEFVHIKMGMKFPEHGAWTVFVVDDISLTNMDDGINVDVTNFIVDGTAEWDENESR
ncbi:MAG: hypothetical protein AAF614_35390 [Chloroflexota bacterium]